MTKTMRLPNNNNKRRTTKKVNREKKETEMKTERTR